MTVGIPKHRHLRHVLTLGAVQRVITVKGLHGNLHAQQWTRDRIQYWLAKAPPQANRYAKAYNLVWGRD